MSKAVVKGREKPIDQPRLGKAKVLKFDRRAGVIVLEQTERPCESTLMGLVRKLLSFLRPIRHVARSPRRTQAAKSR